IDILRTAVDVYINWKTELNEHFRLDRGDKNALNLTTARYKVPNKMEATI
ncbi:hypothetical protein PanWU01x14_110900, partial [Parasponia andersonii]